jgi:hypothetical protein
VSDLVNGGDILQSKLPSYVRSALESRFAHNGFGLEDAAMMIAAVERLAFDEVIKGVELAFQFNGLRATDGLSQHSLSEVLSSYLIIEMLEGSIDEAQHREDKANINEIYPNWNHTFTFLLDVAQNDGFERKSSVNPFKEDTFSFEDAARVAQRISEEFGEWSNHECHEMRSALAEMDVHSTGRVKLSDFYKNADDAWQFREASEYLRHLGALDESSPSQGPSVIIPNYVGGMSNCITSAPYYSVCCLNECDRVYEHLEAAISAPTASADEILRAVEGMPHIVEARDMTATLRGRLEEIVAVNGGKVPLHGRLLAQWLHYVFPRSCPYPHEMGNVHPQSPAQWEKLKGEEAAMAGDDEVVHFLETEAARLEPSPEAGLAMWNMKEVLLDASTPSDAAGMGKIGSFLRTCMHLGIVGAIATVALKELSRVLGVTRPKAKAAEYNV